MNREYYIYYIETNAKNPKYDKHFLKIFSLAVFA